MDREDRRFVYKLIALLVNVVKGIGRQVVIDLNGAGTIERKYEYKKI